MLSHMSIGKALGRFGRFGRLRIAARLALAAALLFPLTSLECPVVAQVQPVRGEMTMSTTGGYGRLVVRLDVEMETEVRVSSGVLIVQFKRPVDIAVDRITAGAGQYFGAARRDPDGKAVRFALQQKLKVSTTTAGERLFVDLMPESWTGEPPGLPREIVEDLARRARAADRQAQQRLELEALRRVPVVRVRVANQSTFTRYIFELPEMTPVGSERSRDKLTLSFAANLRFDLSDAKLSLPKTVEAIDADNDGGKSNVKFSFAQPADVRSFREDANYVVDVTPVTSRGGPPIALPQTAAPVSGPLAGVAPPDTVPAKDPPARDAKIQDAKNQDTKTETRPEAKPDAASPAAQAEATAPRSPPRSKRRVARQSNRPVAVELRRQGDALRLFFPFAEQTPAAVFQRAETLWLVFDTAAPIDIEALGNDASKTIRSAELLRQDEAQVVRLRLERPRLTSVGAEADGWAVSIGDAMQSAVKPLSIARNIVTAGRASISIPFDKPHKAHWIGDPDIGDRLLVVTGTGPARGLMRTQDFVDLRALTSAHGIAIQPYADDIAAELSVDKVLLARPGGLTLSEADPPKMQRAVHALTFDTTLWSANRSADYIERQFELVRAAAESPFVQRTAHRLDLARFYFSRQMFAEAKSVLDTAIMDERPTAANVTPLVLRAIANIMLGRFDAALKDLNDPVVGNQNDAQIWRALVAARQGRWPEAREAFRYVEAAMGSLPLELQQVALRDALRASSRSAISRARPGASTIFR